ncbi:MAG: serine hydrolase, partial [bacterium]
MKKLLHQITQAIVLLFFLLWIAAPTYAQENPLKGLDSYVEKARHDWQVPGLAIGIVHNGSLIFARGYGVRELGKPDKVDEHTL